VNAYHVCLHQLGGYLDSAILIECNEAGVECFVKVREQKKAIELIQSFAIGGRFPGFNVRR
jgi:hypothetical protein